MTKVSVTINFEDIHQFIIDNPSKINEIMKICKQLRLTDHEIEILKYIKSSFHECTSISVSERFNSTTKIASTELGSLFKRGYLMRRDVGAVSGGTMYEYELTHKGNKYVN